MSNRFVMCVRDVAGNSFTNEPGPTKFLVVPAGKKAKLEHEETRANWVKKVRRAAVWGKDSRFPERERGDILIFVHGYNNDSEDVRTRHEMLEANLGAAGFKGVVVSFDWPSAGYGINYLEDRHDAKDAARQLVDDGIRILSEKQAADCSINVHVLGHSTGAYIIREAFDDADDCQLPNPAWMASQVVFIAGDISAGSMSHGNSSTDALYRHCTRLTNYSNHYDSVLKLSNAKRVGMAPRVGRVGLPEDAPSKTVNVDCSAYFDRLQTDPVVKAQDQVAGPGAFDHSWHFGNKVFARDLFETLRGDLDRSVIPTRTTVDGKLHLVGS